VIPVVVGSNPIGHPSPFRSGAPRKWQQPRIDCAATPGAACCALASAALAQIRANLAGAIDAGDPEYLHQLRVGVRRLRAVLRIFRKLTTSEARRIDRRLRRLTLPLGEARDWDVFVSRRVAGTRERKAAHSQARSVLRGAEFKALLLATQHWAARQSHAGRDPLTRFAAKALRRLHRKVLARSRDIDWRDEEERHKVRIAVRRLRYAGEFFGDCFPKSGVRRYLRKLARLQDILGELNDIAVEQRLLARLERAGAQARLAAQANALLRRLMPAWRAFEDRPCFWRAAR
jgi:triphosphatase